MTMVLMSLLSGPLALSASGADWMAGVARVEITPMDPLWLAGYAARTRPAERTMHPLWVKALALEDTRGRRGLLITADILGFPKAMSDRIFQGIQQRLGLGRAQVILNSSHTHSGPVLSDSLICIYPVDAADLERISRYTAWLEDRVVEAAEAAFQALAPASLASGQGVVRFAVNRRNNSEAAILETHELNGPVDHAVPVLRVEAPDGTLQAVLFGYACHNTVLDQYEWNGDYAGFAQIALEQAHSGATAMFFAGCGADQNPLPRRSAALAEQYGRELAAAVERALKEPMRQLPAELDMAASEVELELSEAPTRGELERTAAQGPDYMRRAAEGMIAQLDAGEALRSSYPYPVQVWRLGPQPLVALGGEVVVEYAIAVKAMLGRDAIVMGYSNDLMSYIPSERVLEEGGYEGDTSQLIYGMPSKWRSGIERQILTAVRETAARAGLP